MPQKVHFNKQTPKRQEKGGHFAQKGGKIALCRLRWFKLNVSKCQKMSSCQKDAKCQVVKHLDYGGGSEKK